MNVIKSVDLSNPEYLQKRIIRFAVLGIIFTAFIIGLSTGLPLYIYGKEASEKALEHNASTQAMTIRELFLRYQDIAAQVSTRTRARERLVTFNNGLIDINEFKKSVEPILTDAMSLSQDIAGITRFSLNDDSRVEVGIHIPKEIVETVHWDKRAPLLTPPVKIGDDSYLLVLAAISSRKNHYLGFDVLAFRLDRIHALIQQFKLAKSIGELDVGWKEAGEYGFLINNKSGGDDVSYIDKTKAIDMCSSGISGVFINTNVLAHAPVKGFNWSIMISATKGELYRKARNENMIVIGTIMLIILLGIWGLNKLIRPLAGKILIQSDELKQEVDQKTAELQNVNRALHALSAGNEAIVRAKDETQLLESICKIVVEIAGYRMAWVGLVKHDDNKSVIPVSQFGFEEGYLQGLNVSWGDNEFGQGPTGKAIRFQKPFVANITNDKDYSPWREQAEYRGYASSIALPLINGVGPLGALNIYAEESDAFNDNEKQFLIELANDLSYGISMLRAQAVHEKTQDEMRKLSRAVEQADNMVVITNRDGLIEYVNPEFEKVTGFEKSEVIGLKTNILKSNEHNKHFYSTLWETINAGNSFYEIFTNRKKTGELFYEEKTITPIKNQSGEITHFVSTGKDISERIQDQQRIEYMAYHDNLTELPNRELFRDRLEHALAQAHRKGTLVAVMFLDLDRFKQVNDSLGHMVGDLLLKAAADRLRSAIREGDTVARIGGDEFTVVCEDCGSQQDVCRIATHIVESLSQPFYIKGNEIYATASVGIAIYPQDANSVEELITAADTAMYKAKVEGRNNYQFYTADLSSKIQERVLIESELRRALKNNEFELFFQPRVCLNENRVLSVEVLLRWRHPERGLIDPDAFVSVLEETNLIVAVTEWVLRECCLQLKQWENSTFDKLQLAVNLSVNLFRQGKILDITQCVAEECKVRVSNMELEITESLLMEDVDSCVGILQELKGRGFQITIDDFGTGYSSMSYLKRLPIDCVKIDQSFVKDVDTNKDDEAIVRAIISLAHSLGLKVTAEGVENLEQLKYLIAQGCDEGQGYWFSRPLPLEEFEKWFVDWNIAH